MDNFMNRLKEESENDYIHRICLMKDASGWTWQDIADILNKQLNQKLSKDAYRMRYRNYNPDNNCVKQLSIFDDEQDEKSIEDSLAELLLELKKERVKISDERSQNSALIRRMSREETLVEIAKTAAESISKNIQLPNYIEPMVYEDSLNVEPHNEGILLVSDWHYGIDINNYFNRFNPEIARSRVAQLKDEVINIIRNEPINLLHVVNLGDLISGRIHSTIRINNRIDVITQAIEVSEILAEMLNELSKYAPIAYYDTLDNHSRLEPNLKESLDLESLARVVTEFIKLRLKHNNRVSIFDNQFSDDIITFESCGHPVCAVHGDKDKPNKVIDNLTMMTEEHFDLICTAHLHHWNADEKNFTRRIGNGSLMGTDDFAQNLRLTSSPSQTLIIASPETVTKAIYIIDLE